MTRKLIDSLSKYNKSITKNPVQLSGMLGIPIGGHKLVQVPGRNSFVYVRLRNNQNELIEAFNNQVAPSYNLPVKIVREGNKYIVLGVDTPRYENNWPNYSPYLPSHGNTHSFNPDGSGGGDMVWVYGRQFMPMLTFPSGTYGGPNVLIAEYVLKDFNGNWKFIGGTGTQSLTQYKPTGSDALMVLVYVDATTGNPNIIVGSGSHFSATLTGTMQIVPYIPTFNNNPVFLVDSAIRLVSGTSVIGWDNIYDVRQFIPAIPTGSVGGGLSSIAVQDEGTPQGNVTTFNFVGPNVDASVSGSVARIFISGSTGGGGIPSGTIQIYNSGTFVGSADKLDFQFPIYAGFTGTRAYPSLQGGLLVIEDVSAQIISGGTVAHFTLTGTIGLGTDRLFYNGLHQQRSTHYTVDGDGRGFQTLFTGSYGDVMIMEYGNIGAQLPIPYPVQIVVTGVTVYDDSVNKGVIQGISFDANTSVVVSGTNAYVSSNPAGDYVLIQNQILASYTGSIVLAGIPATYTHLEIRASLRMSGTVTPSPYIRFQLNGDATIGTNYVTNHLLFSVPPTAGQLQYQIIADNYMLYVAGQSGIPTGTYSSHLVKINDYTNNKHFKTLVGESWSRSTGTFNKADDFTVWNNTGTINKIELIPVQGIFCPGCEISLYGLR